MKTLLDELRQTLEACQNDASNLSASEQVTLHQRIKAVMLAIETPAVAQVAADMPHLSRKTYIATLVGLLAQAEYLFRPEGGRN
jgi:hypothetical protein